MERKGIIAAGNMLVDHVHQIGQWPERGWLVEIVHSERATGGAPLNVLLTLAKMHAGLPLQAVGLIGEDNDGDYITAMLDQYHINRQLVQRTSSAPTSMTQVMTDAEGQRTFFHSPGANRLLDLPAFEPLDAPLKIFHLGYLLLLESLDRPDEVYGTRSARLLAQMRERGYEVSLDLVSRKGDPRYRPLVLPALKHLDYLTINELEASEFSGLEIRLPNGEPHVANIARAASALLDAACTPAGSDPLSGGGMGRLPYRSRALGTVMAAAAGGDYRQRRRGGRLLRRPAVRQPRTLAVNRQSAAGSRLRPRQPAGRQCDRRRQNAP